MKDWFRKLAVPAALAVALAATAGPTAAQGGMIDPANFVPVIDNPYWPLIPGTTFFYQDENDDELVRVETAVTYDVKVILGVNCTVVHDREWVDGVLAENTFDWYAQDVHGNVWYLGEYTEELDDMGNVISTEGSWEAGVDGALPGIIIPADPKVGLSYDQEFYEGEAEDEGKVLKLDASVATDFGEFDNCMKTKEYTKLSPGDIEHKWYCPGTGLVLVESLKEKTTYETLVDIVAGP